MRLDVGVGREQRCNTLLNLIVDNIPTGWYLKTVIGLPRQPARRGSAWPGRKWPEIPVECRFPFAQNPNWRPGDARCGLKGDGAARVALRRRKPAVGPRTTDAGETTRSERARSLQMAHPQEFEP